MGDVDCYYGRLKSFTAHEMQVVIRRGCYLLAAGVRTKSNANRSDTGLDVPIRTLELIHK